MKYYRIFIWKALEVDTMRLIGFEEKSDHFQSQYVTRPFNVLVLHGLQAVYTDWSNRQRGKEMKMYHCTDVLAVFI